jgi:hypothetical protein
MRLLGLPVRDNLYKDNIITHNMPCAGLLSFYRHMFMYVCPGGSLFCAESVIRGLGYVFVSDFPDWPWELASTPKNHLSETHERCKR